MRYITSIERFAERSLLLKLFKHRFGTLPSQYRKKLNSADPKQLMHWGKCLVDAKTLEEIFTG